ncbi:MAG: hypothetical protein IH845_04750 [Nanoarchaeota archaeon]|nr:hypothetical protein [Nanoarchaeota archaeon]
MVSEYIGYFGILGVVLIVLGWIPETIEIIRKKKNNLNLKFNILYTLGSLFLVIYSIYINDLVFILLNGFAFLMSSVGLFYTIRGAN